MPLRPRSETPDAPAPAQDGQDAPLRLRPRAEGHATGRGAIDRPYDFSKMQGQEFLDAKGSLAEGSYYFGRDRKLRRNVYGAMGNNPTVDLPPGAYIAPDANIYRRDPQGRNGSTPRLDHNAEDGWYYKSGNGQNLRVNGKPASEPNGVGQDMRRGYRGGLLGSMEDTVDSFASASPFRRALGMLDQAPQALADLKELWHASQGSDEDTANAPIPHARNPMQPGPLESVFTMRGMDSGPMGGRYRPRTGPGRIAQTAGAMTPNVLVPVPEAGALGLVGRLANVVLPTVGSEGAKAGARALGADENVQQYAGMAGGFLGGMAGGIRPGARPPPQAAAATSENVLRTLGVAPEALPPQPANALRQQLARGADPSAAATKAAADSLPIPVPMSKGDMTGNPVQQMKENAALRGANGEEAANVMRGFKAKQQGALRANTEEINRGMTGGEPVSQGEGGAAVSAELNNRFENANANINDAYNTARSASEGVTLPSPHRITLGSRLKESLSGFTLDNVPKVKNELNSLGATGSLSLDEVQALRTRLSNLRGNHDLDAVAAGKAVKGIDDFLEEGASRDLFSGDPAALDAWKTAIGQRRAFGKLFEGDDLIEGLTERTRHGSGMALKVAPEDAANYIFGRSVLGFVGRRNMVRDSARLREVLGAESAPWNKLRAELFARVVKEGEGPAEHGMPQFSGQKFAKAWNGLKNENPGLTNIFFTKAEQATIDHFTQIAQKVTTSVRGGDNPSNTAIAILRTLPGLHKLFGALRAAPYVEEGLQAYKNTVDAANIRKATIYAKPPKAASGKPTWDRAQGLLVAGNALRQEENGPR